MDHQLPPSSASDPLKVDLAATRRRFLVAREQSASQSSIDHIRSMAIKRWWERERRRVDCADR